MSSNVVHLGNREPHKPIVKGGRVVGHETADVGPSVSEFHWQPEIAALLKKHADQISESIEENREAYVTRLLTMDQLEPWEVACKHVLLALAAHARSGISWVAAEDAKLQAVLADLLAAAEAPTGTSAALTLAREEGESWDDITAGISGPTALKTKAGVGVIAKASFGTAAQPAAGNYVALTANSEAASASNTALAGEINKASGGLNRAQATFGFTEATGVATLTITLTANGNDALPVTVEKFGVFNASSVGTMVIETKLSSSVTFSASGDNMTLTETLTLT